MERFQDLDVTPKLGHLTMPVLVLHRRGAAFPTVEVTRRLAADTPGARLVLLEGAALAPFLGDTDAVLAAIDQFLAEADEQPRPGGLTERELEILALLAGGSGNIYLKIGVHNRAEATVYAFRQGIAPAS